jgi:rod shape-determining protein MreC
VVVNRGSQHTVKAGQAVVDSKGIIGQVTRVYPFTSEVTLITDKELSIPIQIERNQLRAIAFGEGNNTLDIPYLPTNVDIKIGDKLVTSGIDGVYPAGLAVATVSQILQNPESPFAKIVCTPVAEVTNHLQLLLLELPETKQADSLQVKTEEAKSAIDVVKTLTKSQAKLESKPLESKPKAKPNAPH